MNDEMFNSFEMGQTDLSGLVELDSRSSFSYLDLIKYRIENNAISQFLDDRNPRINRSALAVVNIKIERSHSSSIIRYSDNDSFRDYLDLEKDMFQTLLRATDFDNEYKPEIVEFMRSLPKSYHDITMIWLNDYYNNHKDQEFLTCQFFKFLRNFTFEELSPINETIVESGLHHRFLSVNSVALSVLCSWGDSNALRIIQNTTPPTHPLLEIKYHNLKTELECILLEK